MNVVNFVIIVMNLLIVLASLLLLFAQAESIAATDWQRAMPGATYRFPADHAIHPGFKTEWWYFTGTLKSDAGKEYGYELTFFRQGVVPPPLREARSGIVPDARSKFVQNDFKFAHFAISDLAAHQFHFTQKISRGVFGDAGFGHPFSEPATPDGTGLGELAWIDNWDLRPLPDGTWRITASVQQPTPMSINLEVVPAKPPVIEGVDGVSQKAAGEGNASCYYSFTRLKTTGTLSVGERQTTAVSGESWFDHEWASDQLGPEQVGWDWFCFQFEDQTEVMLYAMRRRDGGIDAVSSGTWVAADGTAEHLRFQDFVLRSTRSWHSRQTDAAYPLAWTVEIPSRHMTFTVKPRLDDQELVLPPISYWEGAINVEGLRDGKPVKGHGYMELTGYAGALKGLRGQ